MMVSTGEGLGPLWSCEAVLGQARDLLADATAQKLPADRFRIAHLAALRATAAILSAYTTPGSRLARRPTSAWVLLTKTVPGLAAWADYFAAGAAQRAAADAGVTTAVSPKDADELVDAVATFLHVCTSLVAAAGSNVEPPTELATAPAPPRRQAALLSRAS